MADTAEQPTTSDTAVAAAALGRTGPASASDPGTAAAAAAAAAIAAEAAAGTQTRGNALDTTQLDPRKAKRILANRQSAQRSRMKRLQYINELEGRRDKAEAGVRELRSKVDKAQRQHTNLAQVVDDKKAEVRSAGCCVRDCMGAELSVRMLGLQVRQLKVAGCALRTALTGPRQDRPSSP